MFHMIVQARLRRIVDALLTRSGLILFAIGIIPVAAVGHFMSSK